MHQTPVAWQLAATGEDLQPQPCDLCTGPAQGQGIGSTHHLIIQLLPTLYPQVQAAVSGAVQVLRDMDEALPPGISLGLVQVNCVKVGFEVAERVAVACRCWPGHLWCYLDVKIASMDCSSHGMHIHSKPSTTGPRAATAQARAPGGVPEGPCGARASRHAGSGGCQVCRAGAAAARKGVQHRGCGCAAEVSLDGCVGHLRLPVWLGGYVAV